ncbi:SDR family oxidoreductase [Weissella soli]|uniref:SDR family oxidoreductase n=1 Tax=Weissella soli TaxID=155866 RepID=UPI0021C006B5|nr:SDR family oxidoreductase [Weissella soli]MCT8394976.1 SDR family oxidoreductase [Weissella soli]
MTVENKVVVITGASSGIGEATAKLLASRGAKVVLGARRADRLTSLATTIGENASYQVTDVSKYQDVEQLVTFAYEKYGRVDVLYNNAGVMPQGFLREGKLKSYQKMLDINVMGVLHGITAVLPIMEQQKDGLIITTDSVAGHVVYPGSAVYNGTKYAVRAIMEGLRQEERDFGIRSTIISPGAVATELIQSVDNRVIEEALQDLYDPKNSGSMNSLAADDIANAVLYAIDQPKHVAISEVLIRPTGQIV